MTPLSLARSPEEPPFAMGLLRLVLELRRRPRPPLDRAIAHALHGMRVDREAFRRYVHDNRDRYVAAAAGPAARHRTR